SRQRRREGKQAQAARVDPVALGAGGQAAQVVLGPLGRGHQHGPPSSNGLLGNRERVAPCRFHHPGECGWHAGEQPVYLGGGVGDRALPLRGAALGVHQSTGERPLANIEAEHGKILLGRGPLSPCGTSAVHRGQWRTPPTVARWRRDSSSAVGRVVTSSFAGRPSWRQARHGSIYPPLTASPLTYKRER